MDEIDDSQGYPLQQSEALVGQTPRMEEAGPAALKMNSTLAQGTERPSAHSEKSPTVFANSPPSILEQCLTPPQKLTVLLALTLVLSLLVMATSPLIVYALPDLGAVFIEGWKTSKHVVLTAQLPVAILFSGLFGTRYSCWVITSYVLLGLLGLPWFAHGGGLSLLSEPTVGYLLGFIALPFVVNLGYQNVANLIAQHKTGFRAFTAFLMAGITSVLAFHTLGLVGLLFQGIFQPEPTTLINSQNYFQVWAYQLCGKTLVWDLLLGTAAIISIRPARVLFWLMLY